VTDNYSISWGKPDRNAAIDLLCKEHEFAEDRVNNAFSNLEKYLKEFSTKRPNRMVLTNPVLVPLCRPQTA